MNLILLESVHTAFILSFHADDKSSRW